MYFNWLRNYFSQKSILHRRFCEVEIDLTWRYIATVEIARFLGVWHIVGGLEHWVQEFEIVLLLLLGLL